VCALDYLREADGHTAWLADALREHDAQMKALMTALRASGYGRDGRQTRWRLHLDASTHGEGDDLHHDDDPIDSSWNAHRRMPYSTQGMIHTEARGARLTERATISGPKGELAPTSEDLAICRVQGKRVAELTKKVRGLIGQC